MFRPERADSQTRLPTPETPFVSFHEIRVDQTLQLGGKLVEVLPAVRSKPLETELIMTEIERSALARVDAPHVLHHICWWRAGQEFEL